MGYKVNALKNLLRKERSHLQAWEALSVSIAALVIFGLAAFSGVDDWLRRKIDLPALYQVRTALGLGPGISPKLKIFAVDDHVVRLLKDGRFFLKPSEWARIIHAFDQYHPQAIIIDSMFSFDGQEESPAEFQSLMTQVKTPVYVGSRLSPSEVDENQYFIGSRPEYNPHKYLLPGTAPTQITWLPASYKFQKGPLKAFESYFAGIGSFSLQHTGEKVGELFPPITPMADGRWIPNLAFLLRKDEIRIGPDGLWIGQSKVPVIPYGKKKGGVLFNVEASEDFYLDNILSLRRFVSRMQKGEPMTTQSVQAGDVVFLIPELYTGNIDNAEGPAGTIPGNFLLASAINSVMTDRWVRELPYSTPIASAALLLGCLVPFWISGAQSVFWVGAMCLSLILLPLAAFLVGSTYVPTAFPWIAYSFPALVLTFIRSRRGEYHVNQIETALEGMVSPERLHRIAKNPEVFQLNPSGQQVSVMFIDLVGFSLAAETQTPDQVFRELRQVISHISDQIHEHGGIIDNVFGDGLLAFFGYSYDGTPNIADHAKTAVTCAVSIQRTLVTRTLSSDPQIQLPPVPVRIGVNTCDVYIGDLGGMRRIKPTLIGNGVNFAKRLESACEEYLVMLGSATMDRIRIEDFPNLVFTRRAIAIKHHDDLFEATEVHPFAHETGRLFEAKKLYQKVANIERRDQREPLPQGLTLRFQGATDEFVLENFSRYGLGLRSKRFFAKGVLLSLHFDRNSPLYHWAEQNGLGHLQVEVRWGREGEGDGAFSHGCLLKNLSPQQGLIFYNALRTQVQDFQKAS